MSTATVVAEGPVSGLDPFSDAFLVNPFPALEQLRMQGPAVHLSRYGVWPWQATPRCTPCCATTSDASGPRNARLESSLQACAGSWSGSRPLQAPMRCSRDRSARSSTTPAPQRGCREDHAALLVRSLFSAGVDTIVSALRASPSGDRALRVAGDRRIPDMRLGDAHIPAGAKVPACYAGANRDPRPWPESSRFDIGRKVAGDLGYGVGPVPVTPR